MISEGNEQLMRNQTAAVPLPMSAEVGTESLRQVQSPGWKTVVVRPV